MSETTPAALKIFMSVDELRRRLQDMGVALDAVQDATLPIQDAPLAMLCLQATRAVQRATRHAVYPTERGMPVGATLEAMREAVAMHVAGVITGGLVDVAMTGGASSSDVVKASSIDGASLTMERSTVADLAAHRVARGELLPTAVGVLEAAGLLGGQPCGLVR